MNKPTVAIVFVSFLFVGASIQASVGELPQGASMSYDQSALLLADTNTKKRRDNRQDDRGRSDDRDERRDCRDDDGAVGKDKRDCKQDSRRGEDKKDKDDKDDKDQN